MGSGASNSRVTAAQLVTGKPDDASDIKDLANAKKEIIYYRKLAKMILSGKKYIINKTYRSPL